MADGQIVGADLHLEAPVSQWRGRADPSSKVSLAAMYLADVWALAGWQHRTMGTAFRTCIHPSSHILSCR